MPDSEKVAEAIEHCKTCQCNGCPFEEHASYCLTVLEYSLRNQRGQKRAEISVDIVEVIRCKNCRFYTEPNSKGDRCDKIHWSRGEDWFCADGKRREGR